MIFSKVSLVMKTVGIRFILSFLKKALLAESIKIFAAGSGFSNCAFQVTSKNFT